MQSSVFDLETSVSTQQGATRARYVERPPARDVTGRFAGVPITFQWTNPRHTYFVPSRSYIRMRCKLIAKVPSVLGSMQDPLPAWAPSLNFGHQLWQSCQWKIGNKTVSRLQDYVGQIGALDHRLSHSTTWLNSVGAATNFTQESFESRAKDIHPQYKYWHNRAFGQYASVRDNKVDRGDTPFGTGFVDGNGDAVTGFSYSGSAGAPNPYRVTFTKGGGAHTALGGNMQMPNSQLQVGSYFYFKNQEPVDVTEENVQVDLGIAGTTVIALTGNILSFRSPAGDGNQPNTGPPNCNQFARGDIIRFTKADRADEEYQINSAPAISDTNNDNDTVSYQVLVLKGGNGNLAGAALTTNTLSKITYAEPDSNARIIHRIRSINLTGGYLEVDPVQFGGVNTSDPAIVNSQFTANNTFVEVLWPEQGDEDMARGAADFEVCFQLPLSIWKHEAGIPACTHQLELMPKTEQDLIKNLVETRFVNVNTADLDFKVEEMLLHCYEVDGDEVDNTSFLLDLEQTMCQPQQMTGSGAWSQRSVDVSPSTFGLTLTFQDTRINDDTRLSAARFSVAETRGGKDGEQPVWGTDIAKYLRRFYVQYAGQNHPSPDGDPELDNGDTQFGLGPSSQTSTRPVKDFRTERYVQTMMNNGHYWKEAPEGFEEFYKRGAYYYFPVPRDDSDRSTRVVIATDFDWGTDKPNGRSGSDEVGNTNLMVFDHSRQVCKITIENGMVSDVQLQDD